MQILNLLALLATVVPDDGCQAEKSRIINEHLTKVLGSFVLQSPYNVVPGSTTL